MGGGQGDLRYEILNIFLSLAMNFWFIKQLKGAKSLGKKGPMQKF